MAELIQGMNNIVEEMANIKLNLKYIVKLNWIINSKEKEQLMSLAALTEVAVGSNAIFVVSCSPNEIEELPFVKSITPFRGKYFNIDKLPVASPLMMATAKIYDRLEESLYRR